MLEGTPDRRVHSQGKDRVDKALSWHPSEQDRAPLRKDLVAVSPCKDCGLHQMLKLGLPHTGLQKGRLYWWEPLRTGWVLVRPLWGVGALVEDHFYEEGEKESSGLGARSLLSVEVLQEGLSCGVREP